MKYLTISAPNRFVLVVTLLFGRGLVRISAEASAITNEFFMVFLSSSGRMSVKYVVYAMNVSIQIFPINVNLSN